MYKKGRTQSVCLFPVISPEILPKRDPEKGTFHPPDEKKSSFNPAARSRKVHWIPCRRRNTKKNSLKILLDFSETEDFDDILTIRNLLLSKKGEHSLRVRDYRPEYWKN